MRRKTQRLNLQKNGAVRDAVEAGQVAFGLSNHYYWYLLAQSRGGERDPRRHNGTSEGRKARQYAPAEREGDNGSERKRVDRRRMELSLAIRAAGGDGRPFRNEFTGHGPGKLPRRVGRGDRRTYGG